MSIKRVSSSIVLVIMLTAVTSSGQGRAMTVDDMMRFLSIRDATIGADGRFVAYTAAPDRGDGEVRVCEVDGDAVHVVARGGRPAFSKNGAWVAVRVEAPLAEREKKKGRAAPKPGLTLVRAADGTTASWDRVRSHAFSDDSAWLAMLHHPDEKKAKEKPQADGEAAGDDEEKPQAEKKPGGTLRLRRLGGDLERVFSDVESYAFDPSSRWLAWATSAAPDGIDAVHVLDLSAGDLPPRSLDAAAGRTFASLAWSKTSSHLAWTSAVVTSEGRSTDGHVKVWRGDGRDETLDVVDGATAGEGWLVPSASRLRWSKDGARLFVGLRTSRHEETVHPPARKKDAAAGSLDVTTLLAGRELDVWHWRDERIASQRRKNQARDNGRQWQAVVHLDSGRLVRLADEGLPDVTPADNPRAVLASSSRAHGVRSTWEGRIADWTVVSLADGTRTPVLTAHRGRPSLSPGGRWLAWYADGQWHLRDLDSGGTRCLTRGLDVSFANEDHDYPYPTPGYGIAGWLEDDAAVLIYDKYDIWQFSTGSDRVVNLTGGAGRRGTRIFRVVRTDPEADALPADEELLLTGYHDVEKRWGFHAVRPGRGDLRALLTGDEKVVFRGKARDAGRILFTRERYDVFPDLWVAGERLDDPARITDVNPKMKEIAWGTAELVSWNSVDGTPLQGVLIKPGNYEKGKRYPVVVYFYRFFSQRLNEFNPVVVNHRPCFPFYASNGYAVFLPDVRFEIGRPGFSATKCVVPGVQKLIDMGIADPDAVGLHGHSWSGYTTSFIVTQTDLFRCAVAGAPVSNMTSAYGGIRWGTGISRQFQYERTQSRLGGSLWEARDLYIDNSPVFFADRIRTPLLIQFGDEDGAVPWYQGIELYMAMRRLEKECVFLQYRGEPHHLQKYPNKLDYTLKMMEWFDHYLKGRPAPEWIEAGSPAVR